MATPKLTTLYVVTTTIDIGGDIYRSWHLGPDEPIYLNMSRDPAKAYRWADKAEAERVAAELHRSAVEVAPEQGPA